MRRGVPAQSDLKLPSTTELETTRLEYRISDLSTDRHLVHSYRDRLPALGALPSSEALRQPAGRGIRTGGLAIIRQAPGTANRVRFFTSRTRTAR